MRDHTVPKRQYTEEFKLEAVRLGDSVGHHEAARRLGIPAATLGNWCRKRGKVAPTAPAETGSGGTTAARRPVNELEAENSRLRKELADARLDVEILRKATAYFAKVSR